MTTARRVAGWVFVATVAVALFSPLEGASHRTLTAHMVQHVLLLSIAAPALALAFPPRPLATSRWYWWAAATLVAQAVVVVAWHAPFAFDAALRVDPVHGLEHVSMVAVTAALWWVLAGTRPWRGESVVVLFLSTLPLTVLGVGLLLSKSPWYDHYQDIADQQVAGAVMWAVGGGIAVFQGVALFVVWLLSVDRPGAPGGGVGFV